jgi:hypothetical protein
MVQIYNLLLHAAFTRIHPNEFFPLLPAQSMQAEQISILGLYNVLFSIVSEYLTQLHEIICLRNMIDDLLLGVA